MAENNKAVEEAKRRAIAQARAAQEGRGTSGRKSGVVSAQGQIRRSSASAQGERKTASSVSAGENRRSASKAQTGRDAGKSGTSAKGTEKSAEGVNTAPSSGSGNNKGGKKKLSTKVKRVIRKSVAGVCLASSLLIAAIPADNSGVAQALDPVPDVYTLGNELDYSADRAMARNDELDVPNYVKPSSAVVHKTYTIDELSSGGWQLNQIYEYYLDSSNVNVFCNYNPEAFKNDMTISSINYPGYEVVTRTEYDAFGQEINGIHYEISYDPDDASNNRKVTEKKNDGSGVYTPTGREYVTYEHLKLFYASEIEEYETNENNLDENGNIKAGTLTLDGGALTTDDKLRFFCIYNNLGENYYLQTVTIATAASGAEYLDKNNATATFPSGTAFIVRDINNSNENNSLADEHGFVFTQQVNIVAVGEGAFRDANIGVITFASEIKYLSDEAFMGSGIKKAIFPDGGISAIGNEAFSGCSSLAEVSFGNNTATIGREAFYDCDSLLEVTFPNTVKKIGFGAFAECDKLNEVDLTATSGATIGEYAFYNTKALANVEFTTNTIALGKACFAMSSDAGNSAMSDFDFPEEVTKYVSPVGGTDTEYDNGYKIKINDVTPQEAVDGQVVGSSVTTTGCLMGDYLLANRSSLANVAFSRNYGADGTQQYIPHHTFMGCSALEYFEFSDADGANKRVYYDPGLFSDTQKENFYVYGPEYSALREKAFPRISTWNHGSTASGTEYVPYKYTDASGNSHMEVGLDDYRYDLLLADDGTATIVSCSRVDRTSTADIDLEIVSPIGEYRITALGSEDCLDDVKPYVVTFTVPDGTLEEIGDDIFAGSTKLENVVLGDSVKVIGNNTFKNCTNLDEVTIGSGIESVGEDAFYGCSDLERVHWTIPSNTSKVRSIGEDAFFTGGDRLYFDGDVDSNYLPFNYAMDSGNTINNTSTLICYVTPETNADYSYGLKMVRDVVQGDILLIDYPHYCDLPQDIRTKYQANPGSLSAIELQKLDGTRHIVVPKEVESIDVESFLSTAAGNSRNVPTWIYLNDPDTNKFAYEVSGGTEVFTDQYYYLRETNTSGEISGRTKDEIYKGTYTGGSSDTIYPGLFSCYTLDATEASKAGNSEDVIKGNDWITALQLLGVKEIPDHTFDSCENLESLIIGSGCEHIGDYVFQGCDSLRNSGFSFLNNDNFAYDNNIIYEKLADGTYEINSCFTNRGDIDNAQKVVTSRTDPLLASLEITSLNEGAFNNCTSLTKIDLSDTEIASVPTNAFKNTPAAVEIHVPATVGTIDTDAFADCSSTLDVYIPGSRTYIKQDSFDPTAKLITIWTYKEDPANSPEAFANLSTTDNVEVDFIGINYVVTFYNDNNTVYDKQTVSVGGNARFPATDPTPLLSVNASASFKEWQWVKDDGTTESGSEIIADVRENRNIYAIFDTETFTVTFRNDDLSVIDTKIVYAGQYAQVPGETPVSAQNPDAVFTGWTYNPSSFKITDPVTQNVEALANYSTELAPDGNLTVTFYNDDFTLIEVKSVPYGSYAQVPRTNPKSALTPNYVFYRWVYSPSSFTIFDPVTQNVTAVASYISSQDSGGASGGGSGSSSSNSASVNGMYFVTVVDGAGAGYYRPGSIVTVHAFAGADGKVFDVWKSDDKGVGFSAPNSVSTNFIMPDHDVKVTATFKTASGNSASGNSASQNSGYLVTVENGAGTGYYQAGAVVTITSYESPVGKVFDRWTTSNADIGFSNMYSASTTFVMPTHEVRVTATYKSPTASDNSASGNGASGNNASNNNNNNGNNNGTNNGNTNGGASGNAANNTNPASGTGNTEVRITTETIDNNKKNLGFASVAGSTDNFVLKVTDSAAASAAVEQALRNRYGENFVNIKYVAFDISLYDSTGTYPIANANDLAVTVTLPIPDDMVSYAGNNQVGVVVNGELIDRAVTYTTIDGVPCVKFTATHFSPYTIFVDTGNIVRGMTDATPKTGDGIAPKWFLSAGMLSLSCVLFLWKDKKQPVKAKKQ